MNVVFACDERGYSAWLSRLQRGLVGSTINVLDL